MCIRDSHNSLRFNDEINDCKNPNQQSGKDKVLYDTGPGLELSLIHIFQILLPSLPVQFSVFLGQPGRFPGVNQVRRVEHDKMCIRDRLG